MSLTMLCTFLQHAVCSDVTSISRGRLSGTYKDFFLLSFSLGILYMYAMKYDHICLPIAPLLTPPTSLPIVHPHNFFTFFF